MAVYNKVSKKKIKKSDLLAMPEEAAKSWIAEHGLKVAMVASGAILLAATVYGFIYYKETSFIDAQERLYKSSYQKLSNPKEEAGSAIARLKELIERGGADSVVMQLKLDLALYLSDMEDFSGAAKEYAEVAKMVERDSFVRELALMGEINALLMVRNYAEAEGKLESLSNEAIYYPKGDIIINLAFTKAVSGKKDEAIGVLGRLKEEASSAYPVDFIDDAIRRIDEGTFASYYEKSLSMESVTKASGKIGAKVHEGK